MVSIVILCVSLFATALNFVEGQQPVAVDAVQPLYKDRVHTVWPNGPTFGGKTGGSWPKWGYDHKLFLLGQGHCIKKSTSTLFLEKCSSRAQGKGLYLSNTGREILSLDRQKLCAENGAVDEPITLSSTCRSSAFVFLENGALMHNESGLCCAPANWRSQTLSASETENLVLSPNCTGPWIFGFWGEWNKPPGHENGFVAQTQVTIEMAGNYPRWRFKLQAGGTIFAGLEPTNLVAIRTSDGEEFPHILNRVEHVRWSNGYMYIRPWKSSDFPNDAEIRQNLTNEWNDFFPPGTHFVFERSELNTCNPQREMYTGYDSNGNYCERGSSDLNEDPNLILYSGRLGVVLDAELREGNFVPKIGTFTDNSNMSVRQVYDSLSQSSLKFSMNLTCNETDHHKLFLDKENENWVKFGLVRQGHTMTQLILTALAWKDETGSKHLWGDQGTPSPTQGPCGVQDPSDQNCDQDYGGASYPCTPEYPDCRDHQPGVKYGKCWTECTVPTPYPTPAPIPTDFWLDISMWGDSIGWKLGWKGIPHDCNGTIAMMFDSDDSITISSTADIVAETSLSLMLIEVDKQLEVYQPNDYPITVTSPTGMVTPNPTTGEVFLEIPESVPTCAYEPCIKSSLLQFTSTNDSPSEDRTLRLTISRDFPFPERTYNVRGPGAEITGFNAMIWDENNQPSGIPSQISKNWHGGSGAAFWAGYDGSWWTVNVFIRIPANSTINLVMSLVYEQYGEISAWSHSQLSIVGYSDKWLWEEAALGTGGENWCMDPLGSHTRASVTDIRPKLFDGDWKENVGGADFLTYFSESGVFQYLKELDPQIRSNGPCLSNATYSAISGDMAIKSEVQVSGARTDDLVRVFLHIRYNVVKATNFSRLSLFQFGSETYNYHANNDFFTVGSGGNATDTFPRECTGGTNKRPEKMYQNGLPFREKMKGSGPWWFALGPNTDSVVYDNSRKVVGDKGLIVRDFAAKLGGQIYQNPSYSILCDKIEIGPQNGIRSLVEGDFVDMRLEFLVLPRAGAETTVALDNSPNSSSLQYLAQLSSTAERVRAHAERNIEAKMVCLGAKIESHYPLRICTEDAESSNILFKINGEMVGHVPLVVCGLGSHEVPQGHGLWKMEDDGTWTILEDVVTYRQANYIRELDNYELIFNVDLFGAKSTFLAFGADPDTWAPACRPTSAPSATPTVAPSATPTVAPTNSPSTDVSGSDLNSEGLTQDIVVALSALIPAVILGLAALLYFIKVKSRGTEKTVLEAIVPKPNKVADEPINVKHI